MVGLNLVAPEDHPVALRDYLLQMEMIGFLSRLSPDVKIALHAGELVLGLVPPEHLHDHIRDVVLVAGAHRIGHENDAFGTLQAMKKKGVAAEICLTSNDGISRIDLSNEYVRAATTYGLGYRQLKQFSRNSLEHSFLPGASLWQDGSERAQQPWRLEEAFEKLPQWQGATKPVARR